MRDDEPEGEEDEGKWWERRTKGRLRRDEYFETRFVEVTVKVGGKVPSVWADELWSFCGGQ